jgi:c-di-GMP-related signal transduction protein
MSEQQNHQLFLGRQPILDREQQLFAYELLFRNGDISIGNHAAVHDPVQATSTVVANAFTELSICDSLGPYRGFINIDRDFLFSDVIEALPKERVVFEILEDIDPTPEVIARCQALSALGFLLAADDVTEFKASDLPLYSVVDIIKVDISRMENQRLQLLVTQLKPLGKKLLAEKVETIEQLSLCQELGFELFQGYYFARPSIISGKKLNPSQLALLRLLGLIMEDAETTQIENAFKLEPGLAVNMLRLTNSVSCGLVTRITSLRHAITLLGRRQLQRWLQLLIYTNPKGNTQGINPLLQLAATRGRLMELLSERLQTKNREFAEHAFMVGIMSLMPALLGIALPDILAQLPVAQRVKQALIDHEGQAGQLLLLVEATEQTEHTDFEVVEKILRGLSGINADVLNTCLTQALSWANNLGLEHDSQASHA